MKLETPKTTAICTAIAVGCLLITGAAHVLSSRQSLQANEDRRVKLEQLAKYQINAGCWEPEGEGDMAIGQTFEIGTGKIPTVCLFNGYQYAYVAYLNGNLQIVYVYTPDEVKKQISVIKKEQKS